MRNIFRAVPTSPHRASQRGYVHQGGNGQRLARPVRRGRPGSGHAEGMAQDRREANYRAQNGSNRLTMRQMSRSRRKLNHQIAQAAKRTPPILQLQQAASRVAAPVVQARPKWAKRARESLLFPKRGEG